MQGPSVGLQYSRSRCKISRKWGVNQNRSSNLFKVGKKSHEQIFSNTTSSVTQGRVIGRLVSLFETVDELVDEYDRRRAVAMDEEEDAPDLA